MCEHFPFFISLLSVTITVLLNERINCCHCIVIQIIKLSLNNTLVPWSNITGYKMLRYIPLILQQLLSQAHPEQDIATSQKLFNCLRELQPWPSPLLCRHQPPRAGVSASQRLFVLIEICCCCENDLYKPTHCLIFNFKDDLSILSPKTMTERVTA